MRFCCMLYCRDEKKASSWIEYAPKPRSGRPPTRMFMIVLVCGPIFDRSQIAISRTSAKNSRVITIKISSLILRKNKYSKYAYFKIYDDTLSS